MIGPFGRQASQPCTKTCPPPCITCGADGAADDEGELEEEEEDAEEADDDGLHRDPVQLGILVPDLQTIRN